MSFFITNELLRSFHVLFTLEETVNGDTRRIFDELFKAKCYEIHVLCQANTLTKKTAVRAVASWRLVFPENIRNFSASLEQSKVLLESLKDDMWCPALNGPLVLAIQELGFQSELCLNDFKQPAKS